MSTHTHSHIHREIHTDNNIYDLYKCLSPHYNIYTRRSVYNFHSFFFYYRHTHTQVHTEKKHIDKKHCVLHDLYKCSNPHNSILHRKKVLEFLLFSFTTDTHTHTHAHAHPYRSNDANSNYNLNFWQEYLNRNDRPISTFLLSAANQLTLILAEGKQKQVRTGEMVTNTMKIKFSDRIPDPNC